MAILAPRTQSRWARRNSNSRPTPLPSPFVVIGLAAVVALFVKSRRSGAADSVPAADIALGTNPLYTPDGPDLAPPAGAAAAAVLSERAQRAHRIVHVVHAVVAVYMFITCLVGLAGERVWSAIVYSYTYAGTSYTDYTYIDIRQVAFCSSGQSCTFSPLRSAASGDSSDYMATFVGGIVVSALVSSALVFAIHAAAINIMLAVPALNSKVRGVTRRHGPYLLAIPWALLLLSIIVWGGCLPYKIVSDARESLSGSGSVLVVLQPAANMIISCSVFGLISLILAVVVRRPSVLARFAGTAAPAAAAVATHAVQAAPAAAYVAAGTAETPAAAAAGDWIQMTAPTGHPYWFNRQTGQSSWTPPAQLAAAAPPVQPQPYAQAQLFQPQPAPTVQAHQAEQPASQPTSRQSIYAATPQPMPAEAQSTAAPAAAAVPAPTAAPTQAAQPAANAAAALWVQLEYQGVPYWFNTVTNESTWTRPAGF